MELVPTTQLMPPQPAPQAPLQSSAAPATQPAPQPGTSPTGQPGPVLEVVRPQQPQRPRNPLANLLPSSGYKLRVRREREFDDPVWVGDYPADRVTAAGSVEPFLGREVAPKLASSGVTGDVTFLVCAVDPNGREVGERARISVAAVAPATAQTQPAPQPPPAPQAPPVSPEFAEILAAHRRAQEEMHQPLRMETTPVSATAEIDALKQMVGQLATSVQSLASRLNEREEDRRDELRYRAPLFPEAPSQPATAAPQLDMLSVIREVAALSKQFSPPPQPQQQPVGLSEMLTLMAQAKQVFQPQQVNVDVSPLENQLQELRERMTAPKRDEIGEMAEKLEALKKVFRMVGGDSSAPRPTGLSSALGSLISKVMENPAPMAEAVERVLSAAASVRAAGTPGAAATPRAETAPRPSAPPRPQLTPQLHHLTQELLRADSPATAAASMHAWLSHLQQTPFANLSKRLVALLRAKREPECVIYLRNILTHFGFGDVPAGRVAKLVSDVFASIAPPEPVEVTSEVSSPPDYTVRVGASDEAQATVDEGGEEAEDDEEDEDDDSDDDSDSDADSDSDDDADNDDDEPGATLVEERQAPGPDATPPVPPPAPHGRVASPSPHLSLANPDALEVRVGSSDAERSQVAAARARMAERMAKARAVLAQKRQAGKKAARAGAKAE